MATCHILVMLSILDSHFESSFVLPARKPRLFGLDLTFLYGKVYFFTEVDFKKRKLSRNAFLREEFTGVAYL